MLRLRSAGRTRGQDGQIGLGADGGSLFAPARLDALADLLRKSRFGALRRMGKMRQVPGMNNEDQHGDRRADENGRDP